MTKKAKAVTQLDRVRAGLARLERGELVKLATACHVSHSTISRIKSGDNQHPNWKLLDKLEEALRP